MNDSLVEKIASAVLYEGYILYPYRRGTKNHHRWTFGGLFPQAYSDAIANAEPAMLQTQCLFRTPPGSGPITLHTDIRFLQLTDRQVATFDQNGVLCPVDHLDVAGKRHQTWQEATERVVSLQAELGALPVQQTFALPAQRTVEHLPAPGADAPPAGALVRTQAAVEGTIELAAAPVREDLFQLTLRVINRAPLVDADALTREQALLHAMASTHAILRIRGGAFVSLIDPPPDCVDFARQCKNVGAWPVLAGEPGATDALLASPIILYDYPEIAPESPGDLFDGTEIDEILSLRIMTLTDEEKRNASALDPRAADMLARTEALARDQLMRLHGTMRQPRKIEAVHIAHAELRAGDRVILRPRGGADAFDILLQGKTATIVAIEQDYENRLHLAVTIDEDPGADIGEAGKIGHRFFFRPDEVEPFLAPQEAAP